MIKLSSDFVLDFGVELIALDHLLLSFGYDFLKYFLHLLLFLLGFDWGILSLVIDSDWARFYFFLDGLIGIEKGETLRKLVYTDSAE